MVDHGRTWYREELVDLEDSASESEDELPLAEARPEARARPVLHSASESEDEFPEDDSAFEVEDEPPLAERQRTHEPVGSVTIWK